MNGGEPRPPRIGFESRIGLLTLAAAAPATAAALYMLWTGDFSGRTRWTLSALLGGCWVGFAMAARDRAARPLQTLSNLLAALNEGDFSIRVRGAKPGDALDGAFREANTLSQTLHDQRLGAVEATALLRAVMTEVDVALFTFDGDDTLLLVNRAAEELLAAPSKDLLGRNAAALGLGECLESNAGHVQQRAFPAGSGRWGIRVIAFRERGRAHRLLAIEDLTRALREEELQAWKRLVRVLGHEFNNSLAPIRSIAGRLARLIERDPLAEDWKEDTLSGLNVIAGRSESLTRFLDAYTTLARLPPPRLSLVDAGALVKRSAMLETRAAVNMEGGPAATIRADGDQIDQALINLIRNAVEASAATGGGVSVSWRVIGSWLEIAVRDEGHGLANTANLFVPFFTTKPGGSGIGLVLARQIAEAHGGSLDLSNRENRPGCEAKLRLPLAGP